MSDNESADFLGRLLLSEPMSKADLDSRLKVVEFHETIAHTLRRAAHAAHGLARATEGAGFKKATKVYDRDVERLAALANAHEAYAAHVDSLPFPGTPDFPPEGE